MIEGKSRQIMGKSWEYCGKISMKILIVGAGAVGGYYGARLTLSGEEATFLARGATFQALLKNGIAIRSFRGDFKTPVKVVDSIGGAPFPDLIMICVKTCDTDQVLEQIRPAVGPKTILLSLQNGVEAEEKMTNLFGKERVLGAVCYIGAEVLSPGVVLHTARGSVAIGEIDGGVTERVKGIVDVFRKAKIDCDLSTNIKKDLWTKLAWNSAFNQVCTIARATVGKILDSPVMRDLLRRTMGEVVAVARKSGIDLDDEIIEKSLHLSSEELRNVKPSMLQDLEKGKRLERETFGGFVIREGKRLGIPTPINAMLYEFLRFL